MRKEKGIFSLINILKDKKDIQLTVVGEEENINTYSMKIFSLLRL